MGEVVRRLYEQTTVQPQTELRLFVPLPIGADKRTTSIRISDEEKNNQMTKPSKPSPSSTSERFAILVEIRGDRDQRIRKLRAFLKVALRCFGIRCLAARPPEETKTFGGVKDER